MPQGNVVVSLQENSGKSKTDQIQASNAPVKVLHWEQGGTPEVNSAENFPRSPSLPHSLLSFLGEKFCRKEEMDLEVTKKPDDLA